VAEVLCWHACCGCGLGVDWAEAVLSYRLQISKSLAEYCEAVGEARPPRSVARISGCIGAKTGAFCRRLVGVGEPAALCVRLENEGPMVEEFEFPLWLAVGRGSGRDTALVTTARFTAASFRFSPRMEVV
jgi:hypothetical protein